MKSVSEVLLQRRSIRRYERESIQEETMQFVYDAIRNTSTSYNGQQFSVIDIDNQETKEALYALTNQKQIKTCNHFLVFCADYNKIWGLAQKKGIEIPPFQNTVDGIMVGIIDAALAMQNALTAALACGLGCCCIGYARTAAPEKIAELLKLPKGVFVVCGLAMGVPRELPDMKPKQPLWSFIRRKTLSFQIVQHMVGQRLSIIVKNMPTPIIVGSCSRPSFVVLRYNLVIFKHSILQLIR